METKTFKLLKDEKVRQRLAKFMAQQCFRNTFLEDLHAGINLPNRYMQKKYSRISDKEMKKLMKEVVCKCYVFLSFISASGKADKMIKNLKRFDPVAEWDSP